MSAPTPWDVVLGHGVDGSEVRQDLSKAPHVLLCGTSGSGKSVGVHALLAGLVSGGSPKDTLITVLDPKRVEFNVWRRAPHVAAVHTTRDSITLAVLGAVAEMDRRYAHMERAGVSDVAQWHGGPKQVPRMFLVCDELADLTMATRDKAANLQVAQVLGGLTRIAQLGRAAGVHLIVATQRPAADTLPGNLRANLGTRWAFRVRTRSESRIALDAPGAERLGSDPGTSLLSWRGSEGVFVQGLYVGSERGEAVIGQAVQAYGQGRRTGRSGGSTGAPTGSKWIDAYAGMSPVGQAVAGMAFLGWCGYVAYAGGK